MFSDTLQHIRERIERACRKAGRGIDEVNLLAVSKKVEPERIQEAATHGLRCFGESRIQEAGQKIPLCPAGLEWHLIGHLQTNKVRFVPELFQMVHSIDSERLLRAIDHACAESGVRLPVLLEVNVSGEGSKFGVAPENVLGLLDAARELSRVDVVGFMTIPPASSDPEHARPYFRRLREIRDQARGGSGYELPHLSMGMSGDFEIAIEEGATWIRLGSVLFGERRTGGENGL